MARRRRDAARRLDDAESGQVRKPRPPLRFAGVLAAPATAGRVVHVRDLVVPGDRARPRLVLAALDVSSGEHLLVTGANGAGKSTLLGVLAGRVPVGHGDVQVAARRVAELRQDVVFPDRSRTPQQVFDQVIGEDVLRRDAHRDADRTLRDLGLLHPRDLQRPVGALSVGQRRRLGLALVVATGPDLLLLDEPTNHLSLALAGEIEEALAVTPGTVLVASHDRWLRRRWTGEVLDLDAARLAPLHIL